MDVEFSPNETRSSKFNAGMLKVQRLHELWDKVNKLNQYVLAFDEITGEENYKLLFNCLRSLFLEVYPKLSTEQKEKGESLLNTTKDYIRKYPLRTPLLKNGKMTGQLRMNKDNWAKIEEALYICEKNIRIYVDSTGMDNPDADDDTEGI